MLTFAPRVREFETGIARDETFLPQQVHSQSDEQCEPAVEQPARVASVRARAVFGCHPYSQYSIMNGSKGSAGSDKSAVVSEQMRATVLHHSTPKQKCEYMGESLWHTHKAMPTQDKADSSTP